MLFYCWASVADVGLTMKHKYTDRQTDILLTEIKVITDLFVTIKLNEFN